MIEAKRPEKPLEENCIEVLVDYFQQKLDSQPVKCKERLIVRMPLVKSELVTVPRLRDVQAETLEQPP